MAPQHLILLVLAAICFMYSTHAARVMDQDLMENIMYLPKSVRQRAFRLAAEEYFPESDAMGFAQKRRFGKSLGRIAKSVGKVLKQVAVPVALGIATGGVGSIGAVALSAAKSQAANLAMKGLNKATKGKFGKFMPIASAALGAVSGGGGMANIGRNLVSAGKRMAIDKAKEFGMKKLDKATKGRFGQFMGKYGDVVNAGMSIAQSKWENRARSSPRNFSPRGSASSNSPSRSSSSFGKSQRSSSTSSRPNRNASSFGRPSSRNSSSSFGRSQRSSSFSSKPTRNSSFSSRPSRSFTSSRQSSFQKPSRNFGSSNRTPSMRSTTRSSPSRENGQVRRSQTPRQSSRYSQPRTSQPRRSSSATSPRRSSTTSPRPYNQRRYNQQRIYNQRAPSKSSQPRGSSSTRRNGSSQRPQPRRSTPSRRNNNGSQGRPRSSNGQQRRPRNTSNQGRPRSNNNNQPRRNNGQQRNPRRNNNNQPRRPRNTGNQENPRRNNNGEQRPRRNNGEGRQQQPRQPRENVPTRPVEQPLRPAQTGSGSTISADTLRRAMPTLSRAKAEQYAPYIAEAMREAGINTPQRQAAFLAQLAHESGSLRYMEELASGRAYEGRRDLGNVNAGDGVRYKGRGPIQLTGRANYAAAGRDLGLDLVNNPTMAARPDVGFRVAAWYWNTRGLNRFADQNTQASFDQITRRINGGYNGKEDRDRYWRNFQNALQE